jgi:uncharacterized protein (TIGR02118 family)
MTAHLLVCYPKPTDPDAFDRLYKEEHLPYAGPRLEGASGVVTKRVVGPQGAPPPFHLISDVSFPTVEALKACAGSQGGQEALSHAAKVSTGGPPTLIAVVDE